MVANINNLKNLRKIILESAFQAGGGHIGGSFSVLEMMYVIFIKYVATDSNKYKLILSKGHSSLALYACMEHFGFLEHGETKTFMKTGSRLAGHPEHTLLPFLPFTTGSLGHGLGLTAGLALGSKLNGDAKKYFCVLGDGELNEGSNWESMLFISQHKLNNLILVLDYNKYESLDHIDKILSIEPIIDKLSAFGFSVYEINGNSLSEIENFFNNFQFDEGKPVALVGHTIKGFGLTFTTAETKWHYRAPDSIELSKALKELS
jgi:transketolase